MTTFSGHRQDYIYVLIDKVKKLFPENVNLCPNRITADLQYILFARRQPMNSLRVSIHVITFITCLRRVISMSHHEAVTTKKKNVLSTGVKTERVFSPLRNSATGQILVNDM